MKIYKGFLEMAACALLGYGCASPVDADPKLPEKAVEQEFSSGPVVGKPAPEFPKDTKTILGKPISLAEYKGKVVVLDFWASWCKPCIEERSVILEFERKYYGKDYKVIGVGLDSDLETFKKYVRGYFQTPTQICESKNFESSIPKSYNIQMIPTLVLIDRKGIVRDANFPAEDLEKKVKALLDEK